MPAAPAPRRGPGVSLGPARIAVEAGEVFTEDNLGALRPGDGISPMRYWEFLGTRATRSMNAGEALDE